MSKSPESDSSFSRQDRYKNIKDWQQVRPVLPLDAYKSLREWWHDILRNYGKFQSYAIILALPGDTALISYLDSHDPELELISGNYCLVIALTKLDFMRFGFDGNQRYSIYLDDQIYEGNCIPIAKLFGIPLTDFPCMLVFTDVRSTEHLILPLKGLDGFEISREMRLIFSTVQKAVMENKDPLGALKNEHDKQIFSNQGSHIVSEVRKVAGKTLDAAIEAWLKTLIT